MSIGADLEEALARRMQRRHRLREPRAWVKVRVRVGVSVSVRVRVSGAWHVANGWADRPSRRAWR